ncbi:MAG: hypothetical protein ABIP94_04760, partial [Planctomycetota bacterium]
VSASNFAIGSLDGLNTSTAYLSIPGTTTTSNDYRLGLCFVDQDTLIGNQGATARVTTFDPFTAIVDASIPLGGATRRALDYAVIGSTKVLAVIDSATSQVTLLNVNDPAVPVVMASANNTTGALTANVNGTGGVAWGAVVGNTAFLYAMSSNQGIQAFLVVLSPLASATDFGTGCDGLGLTALSLPAIGNGGFQLAVTNVPVVSPIAFVAFGTLPFNSGINLTAIGMPGCFGYTNLDIGLFATAPVVSATGIFSLPIPNDINLPGTSFATQGVSLSLATPLSLAASNGTQLVLGF